MLVVVTVLIVAPVFGSVEVSWTGNTSFALRRSTAVCVETEGQAEADREIVSRRQREAARKGGREGKEGERTSDLQKEEDNLDSDMIGIGTSKPAE